MCVLHDSHATDMKAFLVKADCRTIVAFSCGKHTWILFRRTYTWWKAEFLKLPVLIVLMNVSRQLTNEKWNLLTKKINLYLRSGSAAGLVQGPAKQEWCNLRIQYKI